VSLRSASKKLRGLLGERRRHGEDVSESLFQRVVVVIIDNLCKFCEFGS
jgi:hypothetical protein